jgi:hypothetical protein
MINLLFDFDWNGWLQFFFETKSTLKQKDSTKKDSINHDIKYEQHMKYVLQLTNN